MPPDNHVHTANAARYRRFSSQVGSASHTTGETCSHITGTMGPPSKPRPRPQNARFILFSKAAIRGITGRTTLCDQHTQPMDLAKRISDWERQCPPNIDRLPIAEKRPWRPPSPVWAPARFPWWPNCQPSARSRSPSPPPRLPSPPLWRTLPQKVQIPGGRLGNLTLYSTPKSPPPDSARFPAHNTRFKWKNLEEDESRPGAPRVSAFTTQLVDKANSQRLAEPDLQRKQREDDEALGNIIREHFANKQPQAIFNENFSFGPKIPEDENDSLPPLSPRSSCSSLPDLCSQIEHGSLRYQRHDSSTPDMAAKAPRDRLRSTSSPIPILQPQVKLSAYTSMGKGFGTQEVHPGQLVDFVTCDRLDAGYRTKGDARHAAPDHRHSSIVDSYKDHPRRRLRGCRSGLAGDLEHAQKAFDGQVNKRTCDLQRKPRTARDHAPIPSNTLTSTAAEASLTALKRTPVGARIRTAMTDTSSPSKTAQIEHARRRSRVPRCRSTDVFLRTIQESREATMRTKTAGSGLNTGNTLNSSHAEDIDWMGNEPL